MPQRTLLGSVFRFDVRDGAFRQLVETVLALIPDVDAKEFPDFAILQADSGGTFAHADAGITVFDVDLMKRLLMDDETKIGIIAHELAHLFLGHVSGDHQGASDEELHEIEEAADKKAEEWGFERQIACMNFFIASHGGAN